MLQPVKRYNVTDGIVEQIKKLVLQGKLKQGDRLPPERELMNLFQVGRPALRESLKVLESQGLIEKTQRGTLITGNNEKFFTDSLMFQLYFSSTDMKDIFEARRFIERELTYLATQRATETELHEIEQTVFDMEKAITEKNREDYLLSNLRFHERIAKSSGNAVLYNLYQSIDNLVSLSQEKAVVVQGVKNDSLKFHKEIFAAMKERNAGLASTRMVEHIMSVYGFVQSDDSPKH